MTSYSNAFAVFGHPIAHSLSPVIHEMFADQFELPMNYQAIDVAPGNFDAQVRSFFSQGGRGANVTLPHKRDAFMLAAKRTEAANRVGTANVLTPEADGTLVAHNTDGAGLVRDLTERHGIDLREQHTLLLGAGGAAYGVAWSLLDAGIHRLTIVNRTAETAQKLVDTIGRPGQVQARYWDDLERIGSFDLIINATSAGVHNESLRLPFSLAGSRASCYDLSYGSAASAFVAWARTAQARHALDGLGMLVETAADAFEIWHGKRPDTDPVYTHLRKKYPRN